MPTIIPVILAGGEGKRLKPLSTSAKPKQFLKLSDNDDKTLLQLTAQRALYANKAENVITVTSEKYKKTAHKQLSSLSKKFTDNILLEPGSKNTLAAISLAAMHAYSKFDDPILWVMPSDHVILNDEVLEGTILKSVNAARHGKIVIFGVKPDREEPAYGHIVGGNPLSYHKYMHKVEAFVEKPSLEKLQWLMGHKNCWWNSGMFVMSARTLFCEMKKKSMQNLTYINKAYKHGHMTEYGYVAEAEYYNEIEAQQIDKTIIENSDKLIAYPIDISWSDIGSWQAFWELSQKQGKGEPWARFLRAIDSAAA